MFQALEHKISLGVNKNFPRRKNKSPWVELFSLLYVRYLDRASNKGVHGIVEKEFGISGDSLLHENCNFGGEMLKFKMVREIFTNFSCVKTRK